MDLLPVDPVLPNYLQPLIIGLKHLKMAIQLMYVLYFDFAKAFDSVYTTQSSYC